MGTKTLISPEEYLSTPFEWEPEYVRGELRERPMSDFVHNWIAKVLIRMLDSVRPGELTAVHEVRCRMPNGNYRLPDVGLFRGVQPKVPTQPVVAAIEIVSPDEKHNELLEKLIDFEQWGVPNIWVINPRFRTLDEFQSGRLHPVDSLKLSEYGFEVRYDQLVAGLPLDE